MTLIVYVPGATCAVGWRAGVEPPPPHAETPVISTMAVNQISASAPFRFGLKGVKKRNPQRTVPTKPEFRRTAFSTGWVEMERVMFAPLPFARATLDGLKVHEALAGRLLQVRLTLPEYPAAGVSNSA